MERNQTENEGGGAVKKTRVMYGREWEICTGSWKSSDKGKETRNWRKLKEKWHVMDRAFFGGNDVMCGEEQKGARNK